MPLTLTAANSTPLTATYNIDIVPYPFTSFVLPNATATPGSPFSLNLLPFVHDRNVTINASTVPAEASQWLVFNQQDMTLTGTPPLNPTYSVTKRATYGAVNVTLTGTRNGVSGSSNLRLALSGVSTSSTPSGTAGTVPNPTGSTAASTSGGGLSQGAKIGLGVGLGLLGLILLLLLLFCCCRRRKRENKKDNDGDSFVAGPRSPMSPPDPFRKSHNLEAPRNIMSHLPVFGKWTKSPEPDAASPRPTTTSFETNATYVEKPHRMDGLTGIFHEDKKDIATPELPRRSSSFMANGDVIGVNDPIGDGRDGASSFTQSFGSVGSGANVDRRFSSASSNASEAPRAWDERGFGPVTIGWDVILS